MAQPVGVPWTGGELSGNLTGPVFGGVGNTPAVLPYGLKSPYTQTVIVDVGGRGDFLLPSAASAYVATQSPNVLTPWCIEIKSGIYNEPVPFTIPDNTGLVGAFGNASYGNADSKPVIQYTGASLSGPFITGGILSSITNCLIQLVVYPCAISGNAALFAGVESFLSRVSLIAMPSHITGGVTFALVKRIAGNGGQQLQIADSFADLESYDGSEMDGATLLHAHSAGIIATNLYAQGDGTTGIFFKQDANSNSYLSFIHLHQIGDFVNTGFVTDLAVNAGNLEVDGVAYKTKTGTVIQWDRWYPSSRAVREAPTATDTPLILTPASGQSAPLMTTVDTSGNPVETIVDKNGRLHSNFLTQQIFG